MHITMRASGIESDTVSRLEPRDADVDATNHIASSDLEHVERAKADLRAFAPLYETYAPVVYNYCLRRLSHPEVAADAAALVFTRAIAALPRFTPDRSRPGSTFRAWLFTIAHNVVVDAHRRKRDHLSLDQHRDALAAHPHLRSAIPSPDEAAIHREDAESVQTMLGHLPDRQRAIVELRTAGLSGREICQTLGMSESAVKSAQFRAYATLRRLYREAHAESTPESSR